MSDDDKFRLLDAFAETLARPPILEFSANEASGYDRPVVWAVCRESVRGKPLKHPSTRTHQAVGIALHAEQMDSLCKWWEAQRR